jgi:hypothetical protein
VESDLARTLEKRPMFDMMVVYAYGNEKQKLPSL